MEGLTTTLRALAAPRRSVPIALVVVALVGVELAYVGPAAALVPAALSAAFLVLGPWSWRRLLGRGVTAAGLAVFVAAAAVVVAALGAGLPELLALGPTFLTDPGSLAIAAVLYVVGGWGLGRDIELETDLEHVREKAIRTHLDPHFLYNALNAIAEWCTEDPRVAEEATLRLADLLRGTLEALELRAWPLAREVALARDLIELHRLRDPSAFEPALELDEAALATPVPPLVLVGLVENALKHGPRAGHRGTLAIRIAAQGGRVRCEVENPGPYAPRTPGHGLATLRRRLALAGDARATLAIAGLGADRTRATLELRGARA